MYTMLNPSKFGSWEQNQMWCFLRGVGADSAPTRNIALRLFLATIFDTILETYINEELMQKKWVTSFQILDVVAPKKQPKSLKLAVNDYSATNN